LDRFLLASHSRSALRITYDAVQKSDATNLRLLAVFVNLRLPVGENIWPLLVQPIIGAMGLVNIERTCGGVADRANAPPSMIACLPEISPVGMPFGHGGAHRIVLLGIPGR